MSIDKLVHQLNVISDPDGCLVPIELYDVPFNVKRMFYVTGVPKGQWRGDHAHYQTTQLLICVRGKIKVRLDNGSKMKDYTLLPNESIIVHPLIWDKQQFMTGDDILLVLASTNYDKKDYIEVYDDFLREVEGNKLEMFLRKSKNK